MNALFSASRSGGSDGIRAGSESGRNCVSLFPILAVALRAHPVRDLAVCVFIEG